MKVCATTSGDVLHLRCAATTQRGICILCNYRERRKPVAMCCLHDRAITNRKQQQIRERSVSPPAPKGAQQVRVDVYYGPYTLLNGGHNFTRRMSVKPLEFDITR